MSECKVISVSSRKGGVGKSTTARNLNKTLTVEGILMNMVVERSVLTRDMLQKTQDTFGEAINIFDTKIPRTLEIGKANILF